MCKVYCLSEIMSYQQDGYVEKLNQNSHNECNRLLNEARRAIPESIRDQFKSGFRRSGDGYQWYVYLK